MIEEMELVSVEYMKSKSFCDKLDGFMAGCLFVACLWALVLIVIL